MKNSRGCNGGIERKIEGFIIDKCPLKYIDDSISLYLQCYFEYKNGFLPNENGFLDQTAKFSSLITIISNIMSRMEKDYGK